MFLCIVPDNFFLFFFKLDLFIEKILFFFYKNEIYFQRKMLNKKSKEEVLRKGVIERENSKIIFIINKIISKLKVNLKEI